MKSFFKKFKKTKLSIRLIYLFVGLLFLVSYILLFTSLIKLESVETGLRIIALCVLGILLIVYLFFELILLLTKKHKTVVITSFITMLIASCCIIGSLFINKVYTLIGNIKKETIVYTTNLISLTSTNYTNDGTFTVGIVDNETDVESNILAYELIKDKDLKVKISKYNNVYDLLNALYANEVMGIFVSNNYVIKFEGFDSYANIQRETKVLYEYSKEMENQDYVESSGKIDGPFTVLIMGVDSTNDTLNANAAFNGDTLMIMSFNPNTLSATVFSIPRDTYVPIACINSSSKINSSAAYGTACVIDTIENLIDIKIDYYVKMNFKGVVDLVEALGGIDITVPDGINFCEQNSKRSHKAKDLQCIKSGFQHMNGEQALAFARHRKTLPTGDFQRVQHQQLVVEAIANAAKSLSSIDDFMKILDAISANMDSNMSESEILNFYNVGKSALLNANKGSMINIQKTYLTGYDLTMYVDNLKSNVYTFQYYEESLDEIKNALKITLELKDPEITKTFNFSANDTYTIPVIGQKYSTVKRNETIPNFTGKSIDYVKSWCQTRNITVETNLITEGNPKYSNNYENGTVIGQSVRTGKLVKDTSSITVDVITHLVTINETTESGESID